jgi:hypothetical protein
MERIGRILLPIPNSREMPASRAQVRMSLKDVHRIRLGILFADAAAAMGLRGASVERLGPFTSFQHSYRDAPMPVELKLIDARFQAARLRYGADRVVERNVQGFLALARHLQAKKADVVFLLAPSSPEIREAFSEFRELETRAAASLREFAPLLDLQDASSLTSMDFADTVHLTTHGRTQVWPSLRAYLLSRLPDCGTP